MAMGPCPWNIFVFVFPCIGHSRKHKRGNVARAKASTTKNADMDDLKKNMTHIVNLDYHARQCHTRQYITDRRG